MQKTQRRSTGRAIPFFAGGTLSCMPSCCARQCSRIGQMRHCGFFGVQTVVAETRREAQEKYERIKACIPEEGALAWMSGHFGLDFSQYNPDEYIQNIEVPGIQGLFESILYAKGGEPVTMYQLAELVVATVGPGTSRIVVGSRPDPQEDYRGIFSIEKARRQLGFEPKVSLREGLLRCVAAANR